MTEAVKDEYDLIVGASGQDGFYLQELLKSQARNFLCLDQDGLLLPDGNLQPLDICDAVAVRTLFQQYPIERIFYLAAYHHSAEQNDANHIDTLKKSMEIHVYALDHFLGAMRQYNPQARIFYAASSHLFSGHGRSSSDQQILIDENTPLSPIGWYAISKAAGMELMKAARSEGLFAVTGILFNHESERRSKSFLTSKLTHGALNALEDKNSKLELLDISTQVDWGYAPDYVRAMHLSLEHSVPQDYVIATGKLHSIEQYAEQVYGLLGLDWRDFITVKEDAKRKVGGATALAGCSSRLIDATGWQPKVSFEAMVARILHETAKGRNIQLEGKLKGIEHAS